MVFRIRYNFTFFHLFNCKFVDLVILPFSQGRICAPEKSGTFQRFCSPERTQSSGTQFVQACLSDRFVCVLVTGVAWDLYHID